MSTHSAKIYAIDTYGQMHWWKHHKAEYGEPVGISDIWEGPRLVGTGWQIYEKVFNAGSEIYGIEKDGTLKCYKHALYETGDGVETPGAWQGPRIVSSGWQKFLYVCGYKMTEGANNTIYAIGDDADGTLWLYWHRPFAESPESPEWAPQGAVGTGWQHFKTVFANEYGVGFGAYIYAIDADGRLWWYNHVWPHMGVPWGWVGPRLVGTGWQIYKNVFSPGIGIIYAIREDDDTLWWYRHAAWKTGDGVETPGAWEGPRAVHGGWYVKKPPPLHSYHIGWQRFRTVFAFVDEWTPEDR